MKRFLSVILTFILFISMLAVSASAAGLDNFKRSRTYSGHFIDVSSSAWYYDNIKTAYELDLVDGTSADKFGVSGNVTIAQTITMAARMHKIYNEGNREFPASSPWYKSYVDYASQNGIIKKAYSNYNSDISRSEFAAIFSRALPDEALQEINLVQDNAIPDVSSTSSNASEIYKLYRSGILGGNDKSGTFTPNNPIRRSESTAIAARMSDEELRVEVTLVEEDNADMKKLKEYLGKLAYSIDSTYYDYTKFNYPPPVSRPLKTAVTSAQNHYSNYLASNKETTIHFAYYRDEFYKLLGSSAEGAFYCSKAIEYANILGLLSVSQQLESIESLFLKVSEIGRYVQAQDHRTNDTNKAPEANVLVNKIDNIIVDLNNSFSFFVT